MATINVETRNFHPPTQGTIFIGWHGRIVLATQLFRNRGYWAMISHSRDGEMQYQIFRRLGFNVIRGSTGRGGMQALIECIREIKQGAVFALTPDGPRGPSGVIQPGVIMMAKKTGCPLIPVGVSTNRRWLFKSWDRYMIPKPFARGLMIFGTPVIIPPDASEEDIEQIRIDLERQTHDLERQAENEFGHPNPDWHAPEANTPYNKK
jgi:hypothetical protein